MQLARESIQAGMSGERLNPDLSACPPQWCRPAACFVTLRLKGQLRGCIGTLVADHPLASNVVRYAYAAAFEDRRFMRLQEDELSQVILDISVLEQPVQMTITDRHDLLQQLEPGLDGLILRSGRHRATFLPSVWQQLPEPDMFVDHLLQKAGLDPRDWPADIEAERYRVDEFSE